ncbi:MAG TPA: hypothetical protein ENK99_01250 [Campylobacterales bacterium]|nr:hypothetical protein [Campylobacterales bacterium]
MEMILPDQNEILYMLDELTQRYNHAIRHIISNKSSNIDSLYSQLKQNSISNKINMIQREFINLSDEFKRVMDYKITQFKLSLTRIPQEFSDTMNNRLQEKEQNLLALEQNIRLYNPKLKHKSGWAEVIVNDKKVSLSEIKENDIFTIMDLDTRLEVKCLQIL